MKELPLLMLDLDDTLCPEWDFVVGGYGAASRVLSDISGCDARNLLEIFKYEHAKYGRTNILNRLANYAGVGQSVVPCMLEAYRSHRPSLKFYPGARKALKVLAQAGFRLVVITDGAFEVQRNKVEALGISALVHGIYYCSELNAPKPSPDAFLRAMKQFGNSQAEALLIGDDPHHDMGACINVGIPFCRIRTGRYASLDTVGGKPIAELSAFSKFPAWIDKNWRNL